MPLHKQATEKPPKPHFANEGDQIVINDSSATLIDVEPSRHPHSFLERIGYTIVGRAMSAIEASYQKARERHSDLTRPNEREETVGMAFERLVSALH